MEMIAKVGKAHLLANRERNTNGPHFATPGWTLNLFGPLRLTLASTSNNLYSEVRSFRAYYNIPIYCHIIQ